MAHLLNNNRTKNYWNDTTTVKIIVGGWVVYFFRTSLYENGEYFAVHYNAQLQHLCRMVCKLCKCDIVLSVFQNVTTRA